jgi:hypothetical protein
MKIMYCKYCGKTIEDNSRFCSFCGGNQHLLRQTFSSENPSTRELEKSTQNYRKSNTIGLNHPDTGIIIAFYLLVGFRLFWFISDLVNKDKTYDELKDYNNFIMKPTFVFFWSIPLIMAIYAKNKDHKLIMLIVSVILIGWTIYLEFIK